MSKEKKDDFLRGESGEDATKYSEFISSFHAWISPEEQKKKSKKLEDATNKNNTYRKQE